jgi:hypothetical protein
MTLPNVEAVERAKTAQKMTKTLMMLKMMAFVEMGKKPVWVEEEEEEEGGKTKSALFSVIRQQSSFVCGRIQSSLLSLKRTMELLKGLKD